MSQEKSVRWILSKTGVLFLMTTSRVGIIVLSHNTTNIGKLFLAISLPAKPYASQN